MNRGSNTFRDSLSVIYLITTKKIMVNTALCINLICSILSFSSWLTQKKLIHFAHFWIEKKAIKWHLIHVCHVAALISRHIYRNIAAATGRALSNYALSFQTEAKQMCSLVREWRHILEGWNQTNIWNKLKGEWHTSIMWCISLRIKQW